MLSMAAATLNMFQGDGSRPAQHDGLAELSDLLTRAANRDSRAWERLVHLYARRVYAAARSRLGSPEAAEEITQSVMTTVFEQITGGRYRDDGRFESWLFRIAMNRVRDAARARSRNARLAEDSRHTHGLRLADDPAPDPEKAGERSALRHALVNLPEADQEVLSLRHHAELSFQTIASLLDAPLGTVLARHHRALAKLRAQLTEHAGDSP